MSKPETETPAAHVLTMTDLLQGIGNALRDQTLMPQKMSSKEPAWWMLPKYRAFHKAVPYYSPVGSALPSEVLERIQDEGRNTHVLLSLREGGVLSFEDEYTRMAAQWLELFHDLWFMEVIGVGPSTTSWEMECLPGLKEDWPGFDRELRMELPEEWEHVFRQFYKYMRHLTGNMKGAR